MGTNTAFICKEKVAENLKSDFQEDFKEFGKVELRVSCLVTFIDALVGVVILLVRLKMLPQRGNKRGGDSILDHFLQPMFNWLYES